MTALQRAAQAAIAEHKSVRKAAEALDIDPGLLHRISKGKRKTVAPETAAKFGLAPVQSWKAI